MPRRRIVFWCAALLALVGTAPRQRTRIVGSFRLAIPAGPFVSQSRLPIDAPGITGAISVSVIGPGTLERGLFVAPAVDRPTSTLLVAATRGAIASTSIHTVPPPSPGAPLLAVATYESGVALHDPKTFALLGYAPIGGPPGDVTFSPRGEMLAPDTDGQSLAATTRSPWSMRWIAGVIAGNEVAVDARTSNIFVTDRDVNGSGALTRIAPDGRVRRIVTGQTAEGLAIDSTRGMVYVGNVNDATVAQVEANGMTLVRKIRSVERTFGIALDSKAQRLYVVSNTSPTMHKNGGYTAAIDLRRSGTPIVARSSPMLFPLGVALDPSRNRLFVTDEAADEVYVLNARTLRATHAPLKTCRTPWRPRVAGDRLYIPCARADAIDVFDLSTLARAKHAPFHTGGFPLSVALWP